MQPKPSTIKPKVFQSDIDEEYFEAYSKDTHLAIDCEMMGLNPRRDRLCLVQICDSSNRFSLIQILPDQKVAPRLQKLFENPEITKIFHFARHGYAIFKSISRNQITGESSALRLQVNLLALTLTSMDSKNSSANSLMLNIDKKNQSSDWGKKILSKDQLDYAAEDVRYLISLEFQLTEILIRENRLDLAEKCFAFLPTLIELDYLELRDILEH
jgi:ribonuclease D